MRAHFLLLPALLLPLSGCTLYAPGKPALATTTSAEQTQRIFWEDVKDGKWSVVQGLLVANVTWRDGDTVLARDAVMPWLQQLQVKDFLLTDVVVKANDADMTVTYDLQLTEAASPRPLNFRVVSVWQQVPPPADHATRQQKKQAASAPPYLLTVEDLAPEAPAQ